MNTAIIVAAGNGSRFGSGRPKQFLEILGKPIIQYSLERFIAAPSIDSIVVVVSELEIETFTEFSRAAGFRKLAGIVAGGSTRAESVLNGLNSVPAVCDIVAVHDAARPLVTIDEIERTIQAAARTGAACLAAPIHDTIKRVNGSSIAGTVDRKTLRRALTPQAFRFSLLKEAFDRGGTRAEVTDECSIVERLGHPIEEVSGSTANIKVTCPDDMIVVEALIRNGYLERV